MFASAKMLISILVTLKSRNVFLVFTDKIMHQIRCSIDIPFHPTSGFNHHPQQVEPTEVEDVSPSPGPKYCNGAATQSHRVRDMAGGAVGWARGGVKNQVWWFSSCVGF